jgi:mRNA interferase RelE/StbE
MYEVIISNVAKKQLDKIDFNVVKRITSKMINLENEPRPIGSVKLKDKNGFRIRIGDYRVLYEIDDLKKEIINIQNSASKRSIQIKVQKYKSPPM